MRILSLRPDDARRMYMPAAISDAFTSRPDKSKKRKDSRRPSRHRQLHFQARYRFRRKIEPVGNTGHQEALSHRCRACRCNVRCHARLQLYSRHSGNRQPCLYLYHAVRGSQPASRSRLYAHGVKTRVIDIDPAYVDITQVISPSCPQFQRSVGTAPEAAMLSGMPDFVPQRRIVISLSSNRPSAAKPYRRNRM